MAWPQRDWLPRVIKLSNVRLRSVSLGALDVYWSVDTTFENAADYDIFVQRSPAEFDSYVDVSAAIRNSDHFRDVSAKGYHSFYNRIFYRLRVVSRITHDTDYFPAQGGVKLEARPDLVAIEMARQVNLVLQEFSGRRVWIFPRKKSGQRCSVCFDPVTQRTMKSNCPSCFGTSWAGGYYAPVAVFANILTPSDNTEHTQTNTMETEDARFSLGNYPELDEGDIVVEQENVRWRVGSRISKTSKARAMIRQNAMIHKIPKGDPEYALPITISDAELKDAEASPERNYTNPQTLESASLVTALTTLFDR